MSANAESPFGDLGGDGSGDGNPGDGTGGGDDGEPAASGLAIHIDNQTSTMATVSVVVGTTAGQSTTSQTLAVNVPPEAVTRAAIELLKETHPMESEIAAEAVRGEPVEP